MITKQDPISIPEAKKYIEDNPDLTGFMRKFSEMESKDAEEMRKKLQGLEIIKMNEKDITKVIETLPENKDDLNKIFTDVSLEEDEINKMLDIVKQHE